MEEKTARSIELKDSQVRYLEGIVSEYDLRDVSKAVRVLIEFARHEKQETDRIFGTSRCSDC